MELGGRYSGGLVDWVGVHLLVLSSSRPPEPLTQRQPEHLVHNDAVSRGNLAGRIIL